MYKLNIKRGSTKKYEAIIKRCYFKKLWLVVARQESDTKRECKAFYREIVQY